VILYEMLTGKRAFQRRTPAESMTAILNDEPPALSQSAQNIPPGLQRVIHRCLEKSPEQRGFGIRIGSLVRARLLFVRRNRRCKSAE
jgi:serine/threonine protein kinase